MVTDEEIRGAVWQIIGHDADSYDIAEVIKNVRALIEREVEGAREEERNAAEDRIEGIHMDYDTRTQ